MSRLPVPGSDNGTWGEVLNDYLSQAHNADGSLKSTDQSVVTNLASDIAAKVPITRTIAGHDLSADVALAPSDVGAEPAGLSLATKASLNATYDLLQTVASTVTVSGGAIVGEHNPVDATAGALTITLPTGATAGAHLSVEKFDSTTNAVTLTGSIRDSAGTITLSLAHETVLFVADSTGSWWPQAGHKTLSSLDGRYDAVGTASAAVVANNITGSHTDPHFTDIPTFSRTGVIAFTQAQSGLDSLYHPWIIDMTGLISSPINRFYMYYSTNHSVLGGIGLATAPSPLGPWTVYNPSSFIYQDTTSGGQTEWPIVIPNPSGAGLIMYYKQMNVTSPFTQFLPLMWSTSTDGITWTRGGIAIYKDPNSAGSAMTGYAKVFRRGGNMYAYHTLGGGDYYVMGMSASRDGITWITDTGEMMFDMEQNSGLKRSINWHYSFPFVWRGQEWVTGVSTDLVSGGAYGNPQQFVGRLSPDMRAIAGNKIDVLTPPRPGRRNLL